MKRLALSIVALGVLAMPALADDTCIIPEVIADPGAQPPIVGAPARPCTPAEEAVRNTHRTRVNADAIGENTTRSNANKTRSESNEGRLDTVEPIVDANKTRSEANETAIGTWTDPRNEGRTLRGAIEGHDAAIAKNSEAIEDAIALSAAIPDSWLSDSENFAISLGGGFTDGSTAIGAIGTFRINKNLSAYGGGSTLTDGGTWAAKGGVRLGW